MKTKISKFFEMIPCRRCKPEADGAKKPTENEEFERCVMCGELTAIPISLPIEFRENYEIGLGQVCGTCKTKLRKEEKRENGLSNSEIMNVVENSRIK